MNGMGFFACYPDGTKLSVDTNSHNISVTNTAQKSTASMNPSDISYSMYNAEASATDVWSLTGSLQKTEIEGDSATSAITAIAGSAIGGQGGVDETVLYSGTYNTATKSIVFSEPLSSFERIMVLWNHMNVSTVYGTYDANGNAWFQHGGRFINTGAGNCYDFITQWNIADNRLSANFYTDMINIQPTGGATKNGGYNELMPVKVIGIGRKQ